MSKRERRSRNTEKSKWEIVRNERRERGRESAERDIQG